jgi:phosphoribosylglycinamide formyltransferase-1
MFLAQPQGTTISGVSPMKNETMPEAPLKIAVLGSGSGSNCQSIIDAIEDGTLAATIVMVISDVEDAHILDRARRHNIPCQYISGAPFKTKIDGAAEKAYISAIEASGADIIVLAGFMRIIKPGLLNAFPQRIINIHPSLLPAFPGLHAWQQALEYGVKVAGCTVHFVDAGTDTGPIIVQKSVPVLDDDTAELLHARIQEQEHIAYQEALQLIASKALQINGRTVCSSK